MAHEPEEIIVDFLRANLVDPNGTHTASSQTFSGDGATTVFTLTPAQAVQVVTSITISSVAQKKFVDYDYDLRAKTITFTVAPANASNNIVVNFDKGNTDWIFTGYTDFTVTNPNFPRIEVKRIDESGTRAGSEGTTIPATFLSSIQFQIDFYQRNSNTTFTIGGKVYATYDLLRLFARQTINFLKTNIDQLYPKLHDVEILSNKSFDFEKDTELFRHHIMFQALTENAGT